ncbi:hypothetical protein GW17_00048576 [Ensete ventricosum]|nr:hypothetical protein GW17_00048576 [Ensete ventricosum]
MRSAGVGNGTGWLLGKALASSGSIAVRSDGGITLRWMSRLSLGRSRDRRLGGPSPTRVVGSAMCRRDQAALLFEMRP